MDHIMYKIMSRKDIGIEGIDKWKGNRYTSGKGRGIQMEGIVIHTGHIHTYKGQSYKWRI